MHSKRLCQSLKRLSVNKSHRLDYLLKLHMLGVLFRDIKMPNIDIIHNHINTNKKLLIIK